MDAGAKGVSASVVTVRNPEGHALHCMLEEPAGGAGSAQVAAVLLCPGVKTRVGPHRLNRKLAQPFLEHGIPVLRVDFRGLGDSEGGWEDDSLAHIYRQIELGHCVGDARAALDWLESRFGVRRFIVGGLCGAAITALLLAREDPRLWALFAVGLPARLERAGGPPLATHAELESHWTRYVAKLARPAAWLRLLSLRSDYRLMWGAIAERLRKTRPVPKAPNLAPAPDLNPHFPGAMLELLKSGRRAMILFGEQDPRRWDFEEKFLEPWSAALDPFRKQITYSVIAGANHVLGTPAALMQANRRTHGWLAAVLHSGGGAGAIGIHPAAVECVIRPTTPDGAQPCSTNESSSSTPLPR